MDNETDTVSALHEELAAERAASAAALEGMGAALRERIPSEASVRHDAERGLLLYLWAAIDGEQDGDAPGNRELRGNLVKRVREQIQEAVARADRTERERDRLARILAVERGDEGQAPEGWSCGPAGWCVRGTDGQDVAIVSREDTDAPWVWWSYPDGGEELEGTAPSALEAMEAADEARKESTTGGDYSPERQP